jgi:NADH-quinone oxidoreductase subunit F
MCHQTPLVEVVEQGGKSTTYAKVTPSQGRRIVEKHLKPRGLFNNILRGVDNSLNRILTDENWEPVIRHAIDIRDSQVCEFLGRQQHIATEHCGNIAPLDLSEYRDKEGFAALKKVLSENRSGDIIETIRQSGLRGRGGAGFSTGVKWAAVASVDADKKYIIMNGDEGDPGAFMDRMLLESYPYRVIEGMTIAAFAVGAHEGILYIRAEYPLAVERMKAAIAICETAGLLGENILDSGFSLDLRIMEGAGAFVCGEETALLASLEGRRGMPVLRPPYPAVSGYRGRPTLVNNVETYACVPWIIRHGSERFAKFGSERSKGTKVFSLTGKIARGGLIGLVAGREVAHD